MERRVAKLGMHVAVFGSGVPSFMGFGTIIKLNQPISVIDIDTMRRTTPIIKFVRHGTVGITDGTKIYWEKKRANMTLATFSRRQDV
jgi:hypothetical protein